MRGRGEYTIRSPTCQAPRPVCFYSPDMDLTRVRIGVVAGGLSGERRLSLRSAARSYSALKQRGYRVRKLIVDSADELIEELEGIEVVFPCLHGGLGENGTLQLLLELLGISYAGSGPLACAAAADPVAFHRALEIAGLSAQNPQRCSGLRVAVGILHIEGEDRALPPVELSPKGASLLADLPQKTLRALQPMALRAHQALGCLGFSQVDLGLDERGRISVLQLRPNPELTEEGPFSRAAKVAGIPFDLLCELMLKTALKRIP